MKNEDIFKLIKESKLTEEEFSELLDNQFALKHAELILELHNSKLREENSLRMVKSYINEFESRGLVYISKK